MIDAAELRAFIVWYIFIPDGQETHGERILASDRNGAIEKFWERHSRKHVDVEFLEECPHA